MNVKGILIPMGGNEDKGIEENERHTLEYIQEGILSRLVKESGGPQAIIIIIPTASSIPKEVSENYIKAFEKLGCDNVQAMDIRSREDAEIPEYLELMKKANCVMFSGGDQSRIVKYIGGSHLDEIITEKYKNEKFVIAGTSAGGMCMSEEMITGGGVPEAFTKGATRMGKGMGYFPNLILDSHFIRRKRFGRLAEAVARFPMLLGIGLSEDTGLVVKNGNECEVIGSGMVILFDGRRLNHNNQGMVKEGSPMSLTNMKLHILANGDKLNIREKEVVFFPKHLKLTDAEAH